ncbi:cysteine hydrolase [Xenorhabdus nematophila]|uniref:cysteine hydrolase family protein n=1 Tax=Xenorhabdus nematophila TaxID=628 RepID=UPI0003275C52|nr:isochorismatase family cysteine hydrolase [Xenorhabdus nematophila]CEE93215.1 conserved hypothetical protein [Xenorhabdus nematophila str. Anatoliense]CEF29369.1 conserved hypothetical protein [Xenorhabdus nematophila str. Websteri]AYA41015.1 cysteine hydrolase [Xenorhabdus nematophila]KHD28880.1 isochorismatase [Xenorhabdus nematophila]MBA0019763.1 cysteine hydrolase [Xenorhabdus nematophila]
MKNSLSRSRPAIAHVRNKHDWLVVYAHDVNDRETGLWGKHALAGTWGAEVVEALAPGGVEREIVSPKHFYSAFDGTDLDNILSQYGVTEVVLAGQHTHCCIRHTAYSAFVLGYDIKILSDAVCVFADVDQNAALDYLKTIYDAEIITSRTLGVPPE